MRKISIVVLVLITSLLYSCGIFKNTSKSKSKEKEKSVAEVSIVEELEKKGVEVDTKIEDVNIQERQNETERTKIVEETETTVTRKRGGGNSQITIHKKDLIGGNSVSVLDSFGNSVTAQLDTLNNVLLINIDNAKIDETEVTKRKRTEDTNKDKQSEKEENRNTNNQKENQNTESNKKAINARQEDESESSDSKSKSISFLCLLS